MTTRADPARTIPAVNAPRRSTSVPPPSARHRDGWLAAFLFGLPTLLVFGYFSWLPIVRGVVMSVQHTNLVDPATFVGWSNFSYVLQDPLLPTAVLNTLYFAALALVFGFPVPLFLATFIAELRSTRGLYSVLAYLPVVAPPVAAILLWKFLYDPSESGVFNTVLSWVGLGPFSWLNSPVLAMPSMVVEATWAAAGGTVIIYLAALTSVRTELYEAAELDGAGIWARVWHVTLPQIRGIVLILMLLQVIGTLQIFTEPFLFTGGGPSNATMTILLMIYNYAFVAGDYGAATALSVLLAIALALISVVYTFATRKWSTK